MGEHLRHAAAAVALAMACMAASPSSAEIELSGTTDAMVLRAKDATINEFLSGLQSAFHVKIKLMGSSPRRFTGVYSGSMRRVFSHLLDGTDYVIEPVADGLRVRIISASATASVFSGPAEDLAALTALALAAAGNEGSRASRIRQQRVKMMRPEPGQDQN